MQTCVRLFVPDGEEARRRVVVGKNEGRFEEAKRTVTEYSRVFPASGRGTVRGKSFDVGGRVAGLHP